MPRIDQELGFICICGDEEQGEFMNRVSCLCISCRLERSFGLHNLAGIRIKFKAKAQSSANRDFAATFK